MSSLNVNRILIIEANVTIRNTSCIFSAKTDITTLKFEFHEFFKCKQNTNHRGKRYDSN